MSTGYDSDGVDGLVCSKPPDGGALGHDPTPDDSDTPEGSKVTGCEELGLGGVVPPTAYFLDEWVPNCWFLVRMFWRDINADCSTWLYQGNFAPGGTGQTDLTFEGWLLQRLGPTYNWGVVSPSGFNPQFSIGNGLRTGPATDLGLGFIHYAGGFRAQFVENAVRIDRTGYLPAGWHHVAVICNRGGNLELLVDGVSRGVTAGVTNYTWTNCALWPNDATGQDLGFWGGPFALHSRVLTTAEIRNSVRYKTVQVVAETEYAYDVRDLVMLPHPTIQDSTHWRRIDLGNAYLPTAANHLHSAAANHNVALEELDQLYAIWAQCSGVCPTGYILDRSANNRTIFVGALGDEMFANDPFWR